MKIIIIIAGIWFVIYVFYKTYSRSHVDKNLKTLILKGAVILDVRTQPEYNSGHIPGSTNIALSKLRTDSIPFAPNQAIITCCSHGLRSIKAVELLKARGFTNVHNGGARTDLQEYTNPKSSR
ncbi:MAG: rhodanese-like domain-containing protein [Flavipsychrobacter sp.]|nr:rhodanese-like domain-containing protein [Flavipsychrobacter sp.]